uniref:Uncharacterized protein n=1 Tax=Fagus sylvatica TaxID=28930 RepID=A0A2N9F8Z0_FAGSY
MVRSRSRGPPPLVFSFLFSFPSYFGTKIGRLRATTATSSYLLFHYSFLFISLSSDPVWCRGDLLESLGGSSFQQIPSLFSASIVGLPSGRRDLLRRWMFDAHRVWGFFPAQVSINYPTLGKDYLKLFFLKSPCHTQIERKIRFDPVVCLAGIKDLNLPLFWTLAAEVALLL